MRKLLVLLSALLLCNAPAWAQDDAKAAATITPTSLPGEEELSAQERAERDFLMPVRRKRAAALEAVEEKARAAEAAIEAAKAAQVVAAKAAAPEPIVAPVEERKVVVKRKSGRSRR
ncbi:hypothetical protein [Hymenobacter psychrophilus]|uniref:Uncharacterized protein n=1 Tax=Hymenobacter psychrophilus TaxID=651662 RepID=A0A1H3M6I9_9BACT|nr:hypothetical protein [Hymenobacter psychrophilus]SDY72203.1 hypothetical protein SAMN04488069_11270 [Hymenobacter psychrophilus]